MKNKNILKAIAKNLTIAFFISCLIVTILYFVCLKKLENYITLFNNFTYNGLNGSETVKMDSTTKELVEYPSYGSLFGTISMPTIDTTVNLYHGDDLDILKKGAGHYAGSFFPGEGGTILIAAHNRREYFKYLPKLNIGDEIIIKTTYGTFTYLVTNGEVVNASDLENIEINSEKEELVLYTCYPTNALGLTSKRYVITSVLDGVSYES
jgi:sortase A